MRRAIANSLRDRPRATATSNDDASDDDDDRFDQWFEERQRERERRRGARQASNILLARLTINLL